MLPCHGRGHLAPRRERAHQEDFKALAETAHQRGIRVLMDFVPNHTSVGHPYFRDTEIYGEASHYRDYYDRGPDGNPTHYFDWLHLPNLNFSNPEVQRFMLEAFSYWVREFDTDGFRIDAAWGSKERNPEWLSRLLAEINRIEPDSLLIAEASARDEFYFQQGFGAAYDWAAELGHWAWADALRGIGPIGESMVAVLTDDGRGNPDDALVMRFLNNNDTGPCFITTYGVDFYRVALAMLLTLPGLPCLYTGNEVGAEFQPYNTTGPIDLIDRHGLRSDTEKLIALRQSAPSLHSRKWSLLVVESAATCFAYLRTSEKSPPVIVALNFSTTDLEATTTLSGEVAGSLKGYELIDLRSGEYVAAPQHDRVMVSVPAWTFQFLTDAQA